MQLRLRSQGKCIVPHVCERDLHRDRQRRLLCPARSLQLVPMSQRLQPAPRRSEAALRGRGVLAHTHRHLLRHRGCLLVLEMRQGLRPQVPRRPPSMSQSHLHVVKRQRNMLRESGVLQRVRLPCTLRPQRECRFVAMCKQQLHIEGHADVLRPRGSLLHLPVPTSLQAQARSRQDLLQRQKLQQHLVHALLCGGGPLRKLHLPKRLLRQSSSQLLTLRGLHMHSEG
mmetsp:Transcript_21089/g.45688  ORF Transcript_21089/g.45688 Transcript_21089/m.45688 type:complete len:227 (+) Transcript_21089:107-787(+)